MIRHRRFPLAQAMAWIVFALAFASSHAQRPALTKSVDEPGRAPYHQFVLGVCLSGTCRITFKAVPAGFRLVVTHISLLFQASSDSLVYLSDDPSFLGLPSSSGDANAVSLSPRRLDTSSVFATVSAPVTFYVEPGGIPSIVLSGADPRGSINGYLVALD